MEPIGEWHLNTRLIGQRVLIFDQVSSTNTVAAGLADNSDNEGIVIYAREQTAGRGQRGRTWLCEPGAGVLMSVLLFPPQHLRRQVILAAWAANAVCEAILQCTGLEAQIKWPNDILIDRRKVCGILVEQGRETIVGIGVNVNQEAASLIAQDLPHAGSLAVFAGKRFGCDQIARELIGTLDREYDGLLQGNLVTLESSWRSRTGLAGKNVVVDCHDRTYRGRLRELTFYGLRLESADGEIDHFLPEVVKHVTETAETDEG
jgi:BirA family biotin operon repressor/biotin-[acetyl-CoA-carboxylase] ligase